LTKLASFWLPINEDPLPVVDELIDELYDAKWFSKLENKPSIVAISIDRWLLSSKQFNVKNTKTEHITLISQLTCVVVHYWIKNLN